MEPELILASVSPRRRRILENMGLAFVVVPANVEEANEPDSTPEEMVLHNAALKSRTVARMFDGSVVLGADTAVVLEGKVFNKPGTLDEARIMLEQLSGTTHAVLTGISVLLGGRDLSWSRVVRSEVTFRPLKREDVDAYLARVNPLDKAGGYAIQESGEMIVASCSGSRSNVMGLPVEDTAEALEFMGLRVPCRTEI